MSNVNTITIDLEFFKELEKAEILKNEAEKKYEELKRSKIITIESDLTYHRNICGRRHDVRTISFVDKGDDKLPPEVKKFITCFVEESNNLNNNRFDALQNKYEKLNYKNMSFLQKLRILFK